MELKPFQGVPVYVLHDDVRWKVVGEIEIDDRPAFELRRRVPVHGGTRRQWQVRVITAFVSDCQAYVAPGRTRVIRGKFPHRRGRPVVFEYDQQTSIITLRLKRQRRGYTTTLEGLYDLCARQQAANAKRDALFKRRTRRK